MGHNMKHALLLRTLLFLYCASLLAQNKQSTTEQEVPPPSTKVQEKVGYQVDPATTRGPISVLSDTAGVDVRPYLDRVLPILRANWYKQIPPSAHLPTKKSGQVKIKFLILKDGHIADVLYIDSSGDAALDRAAYAGVTGSSPLPSLPSDFSCKSLALRISFHYNPTPGTVQESKAGADSLIPCVTTRIRDVALLRITVSPDSAQVVTGGRQQFSAVVAGDPNSTVHWQVSGSGCLESRCGFISPGGLYTAPSSIPNPASITITATLANDSTEEATATVTLVQSPAYGLPIH
jgi:TonB family protein